MQEEKNIVHEFAGWRVSDILRHKKASIKHARLPEGPPDWQELSQMIWEQIEEGARENKPGSKLARKLLTDKRFDK